MNFNHIHLKYADVSAACKFYEEYFGFRFVQAIGDLHFLVSKNGVLFAFDNLEPGQKPTEFPEWFHFGFCLDNPEEVERMYNRLKKDGCKFGNELSGKPGDWSSCCVLDPGGYAVEVSWHRSECEKVPEMFPAMSAKR